MSYRVEFDPVAMVQVHGLPSHAFDALVDAVVLLVDAPWDAMMQAGGIASRREALFGQSGLLCFQVDDVHEVMVITDVIWVG